MGLQVLGFLWLPFFSQRTRRSCLKYRLIDLCFVAPLCQCLSANESEADLVKLSEEVRDDEPSGAFLPSPKCPEGFGHFKTYQDLLTQPYLTFQSFAPGEVSTLPGRVQTLPPGGILLARSSQMGAGCLPW